VTAGWATTWEAQALVLEVGGVLLDDAPGNRAAWRWWAARVDLDPDRVEAAAWGRTTAEVVRDLAPGRDPGTETAAVEARRRVLLRTARRVRGAVLLVRSIPPKRWAIATSAGHEQLTAQLRRLRLDPPAVVVTAADSPFGRPDPAPHLLAAEQLGHDAAECIALESSPAGIAAARGTVGAVVAIGRRQAHRDLEAADAVRSDVGGLQVRPLDDGRIELRAFREPRILPR
jgi:mannitol-1-/sugar-/sorbitol-6-phosphatase